MRQIIPLETQISPIFGLTLLELAEIFGMIITAISFALAIITAWYLNRSLTQKSNYDSAVFIFTHLNELLDKSKEIINALHERHNKSATTTTTTTKTQDDPDHEIRVFLGRLENIIVYVNNGIINKDYFLIRMKTTLKLIKNDEKIQKIISGVQEKYPTSYEHLVKFMKDEI